MHIYTEIVIYNTMFSEQHRSYLDSISFFSASMISSASTSSSVALPSLVWIWSIYSQPTQTIDIVDSKWQTIIAAPSLTLCRFLCKIYCIHYYSRENGKLPRSSRAPRSGGRRSGAKWEQMQYTSNPLSSVLTGITTANVDTVFDWWMGHGCSHAAPMWFHKTQMKWKRGNKLKYIALIPKVEKKNTRVFEWKTHELFR